MLKTYQRDFFNAVKRKLWYTTVLLFCLLITACSSVLPEQSDTEDTHIAPTVKAQKIGPYEQAEVMNQASVVSYEVVEDPLRFINEPIFYFNDKAYTYVLTPLAVGYEKVVPTFVDKGITNFFYNLREPLYAINHLLQGNIAQSGESLFRVLVNTTIGLAGLFDPANDLIDIERNKTTFGNTLQTYGLGHGAYLVLPFLGPSDFRDVSSLAFNYFAHPLNFINDETAAQQLLIFDGAQAQVPILSKYPKVLKNVESRYEFVRNLYMQNLQRDGHVKRKEAFTSQEKEH